LIQQQKLDKFCSKSVGDINALRKRKQTGTRHSAEDEPPDRHLLYALFNNIMFH